MAKTIVLTNNVDASVVEGFGDEWSRFDQSALASEELIELWQSYFQIFPWERLPENAAGFDLGCGSGRWARLVAPRVGYLHCIDPSRRALEVARSNLSGQANCSFHCVGVDAIPVPDRSMDFGYSLGVLHHVPDTAAGLRACVAKLKPGAPFLLYLYYRFDNRPAWFRTLWRASDLGRRAISRLPLPLRYGASQIAALGIYWPAARAARLAEALGRNVERWPLSVYRHRSLYVMRTDALDRFGTRLEQRFTREEIRRMMESAGLQDIQFADAPPYWCAVGSASRPGGHRL